jgi:hypothetical protein
LSVILISAPDASQMVADADIAARRVETFLARCHDAMAQVLSGA